MRLLDLERSAVRCFEQRDITPMYLTSIHIKNLKLISDLELDFTDRESVRRWTVLIGRNGRGKTAILQAIALAAAGELQANDLGKTVLQSFPPQTSAPPTGHADLQKSDSVSTSITATFRFEPTLARGRSKKQRLREFPGQTTNQSTPTELESKVWIENGYQSFSGTSKYLSSSPNEDLNPLRIARSKGLPYWFVAAYGVSRHLRFSGGTVLTPPSRSELQLERMRTLFDPDARLRAIGFASMFDSKRTQLFARFIRTLTTHTNELLPELAGIELRGHGGVTRPEDLMERERIIQALPNGTKQKLPATWLSHGYQSSLSWLSDLLGHILIEDAAFDGSKSADPSELQGLVLIDELDLHLHPSWQRIFIKALSDTFPNIQFIATTHSPILVSGLAPDEVVALELDDEDHIARRNLGEKDPRLLTGSELYGELFDVGGGVFAQELGTMYDDYRYWARNPRRSEKQDGDLKAIMQRLQEKKVALPFQPVERDRS